MIKHPKQKLLTIMISSALTLLVSGCGGGGAEGIIDELGLTDDLAPAGNADTPATGGAGDDTTGRTGTSPPASVFSGIASIAGTIALDTLKGADANSLGGSVGQQRSSMLWSTRASVRATSSATDDNAIIKLFSVTANGVLEDTGITCDFTSNKDENDNPKYTCADVADGQQYVIKYLRILEGDKALEMKVDIKIPEGASAVEAGDVSPQSTVIADAIVNAVLAATDGKDIDPETIDEIIASVKKIVVKLVESGSVQIPSMLVDAPKDSTGEFITEASDLNSGDEVTFDENGSLESASGALLSDEEVSQKVDTVRVEIEVKKLSEINTEDGFGKRELIRKIFNRMLDGDVPGFMVEFFADRFEQDDSVTVDDLFNAVNSGLRIEPEVGEDIASLELSTAGATASLQAMLAEIYELLGKRDSSTLSLDEKKQLAEIPAIIPAIFPATQWSGEEISPATELNVPQSIVFTIFVTDHYVQEVFEDKYDKPLEALVSAEKDGKSPMEVEFNNPVDFNPMNYDSTEEYPGLLQLFGFFNKDYLDSLEGVEISHLDVHPDRVWIEDREDVEQLDNGAGAPGGHEYNMLRANVCISDLSVMSGLQSGQPEASDLSVELSYPTRAGERNTVSLLKEVEPDFHHGGEHSGEGYPDEDYPAEGEFPGENYPGEGEFLGEDYPAEGALPGGDYPGSEGSEGVDRAGGAGGPGFESCYTLDPWLAAQSEQGTEGTNSGYFQPSLENIVSDFVSGQYEVKVKDASGNVVADKTFEKKVIVGMSNVAPQFTSPNGAPQWPVECQFTDYCPQWDEIQQKWNDAGGNTTFALNVDTDDDNIDDKAKVNFKWKKPALDLPDGVKVSYSLNVGLAGGCDDRGCQWENIYSSHERDRRLFARSFTLPTLLDKLELGDDSSYNANLCAEFIDTDNGDFLGAGGCSFAEFKVGAPLDLNAEFKVLGAAPSGLGSQWKVALIGEEFQSHTQSSLAPSEPNTRTLVISGIDEKGGYELKPTISQLLKGSQSTSYSIRLFRDENDNGELNNNADTREQQFWPGGDDNFWFETWGRTLRVVSESFSEKKRGRRETIVIGGETIKGPDFSYLEQQDWFKHDALSNDHATAEAPFLPSDEYGPESHDPKGKPGTEPFFPDGEYGPEPHDPEDKPGAKPFFPDDKYGPEPYDSESQSSTDSFAPEGEFGPGPFGPDDEPGPSFSEGEFGLELFDPQAGDPATFPGE